MTPRPSKHTPPIPEPAGSEESFTTKALHTYHLYHKIRDLLGTGLLSTLQAIVKAILNGGAYFGKAFLFTFPLTVAVALSTVVARISGDSPSQRVAYWLISFSMLSGVSSWAGERFVRGSVAPESAITTLQVLGARAPELLHTSQFLSSMSNDGWPGKVMAFLIESLFVYGLGNFIFSVVVGVLLGLLCTSAIRKLSA